MTYTDQISIQGKRIATLEATNAEQVKRIEELEAEVADIKVSTGIDHAAKFLWRQFAIDAEAELDLVTAGWCDFDAVVQRSEATAAAYKEGVSWSCSCLNCAKMFTKCHEETCAKEEAETELKEFWSELEFYTNKAKEAKTERDELRVALDDFGQHLPECALRQYGHLKTRCNCDWHKTKAALGKGGGG